MNYSIDRRLLLVIGITSAFLLIALFGATPAQADDSCMSCHSNESSPVYVDKSVFEESVHVNLSCSSCHSGYQGFPHPQETQSAEESCASCHSTVSQEFKNSVHGSLFPIENDELASCTSCHEEPHGILKTDDPNSSVHRLNVSETCASCHENTVPVNSYRDSFHGIANKFGSTRTATCADCHTAHEILGPDNPDSTVAKANVPETCASCHNTPQPNFAEGPEHFEKSPTGPGAPMYWTLKFFTWLTITTVVLLIIHIELDLFRRLKEIKEGQKK